MAQQQKLDLKVETAPFDTRFPYTNQARNCWQNYCDYYRCVNKKGEEFEPCQFFQRNFRSMCPKKWVDDWDSQREEGSFAGKVE